MSGNHRRGGNGNRSASRANQAKVGRLSFHKLKTLITKSPEEILFTLRPDHSGFDNALADAETSKDRMALILIAVGKACECDERCTVRSLLSKFNMSSNFIYGNIQKYLCSVQNDGYDDTHLESLFYLMAILEHLQKILPAAAYQTISILLPMFQSTVQKISKQNNNENLREVLKKIQALEKDNDNFIELRISRGSGNSTNELNQQLEKPPNDFRELPILPLNREACLNYRPFLRPIIEDGHYVDVDHYLDVHFRLLREDVLQPLREGIQKYVINEKENTHKSLKDVKLYRAVQIKRPVMSTTGLNHLISFETKQFRNISWENSKRLLFGSLLCLSHDDFQSMLFATVAGRDPNKLKDGLLEIQFEHPEEIFDINLSTNFVMIETNAYFEAYRHVLMALQEITEDTLPLKEYIINIKQDIEPPQYLTPETTYDFQSLLVASTSLSSPEEFNKMKHVLVLDDKKWPSSEQIGLDEHQLEALRNALSKKLAIIQGPPGTGKTYIGLKIIQLLLNNCTVWNPLDELSPLLVVCYTNHALDQFLEGILPFTNNIVRVGGRSSSSVMQGYQLNMLRTQLRNQHKVPEHIFHNINESKLRLKDIQQMVGTSEKLIDAAANSILTADILKDHMEPAHYESFISVVERDHSHTLDRSTVMFEWLGLLSSSSSFRMKQEDFNLHTEVTEEPPDVDEEYDDVEFITNQRIIDVDEADMNKQDLIDNEDLERIRLYKDQIENDWKVKGGYKERKQFIRTQLQSTNKMAVEDVKAVRNIWNLSNVDRWRLYRTWIDQYVKHNVNKILENQKVYKQYSQEFEEIRIQEDINLMRNAKVVGMTTSGAAKYRNIVQKLKPFIVIVEEAAEVLEAHIITSLTAVTQHLILIGDHQQLRPSPTVYELAKHYNLDLSFFERMIKNGMNYSKLLVQHRMRPCISELLVPHIYKELHDHFSVKMYNDVLGMEKNMFFVSHNFQESSIEDSKSKQNIHEADFLIGLCKYLLLQGYTTSQITILTMYTGQMFLLKKRMNNSIFQGIRVSVVDNFQGEENDIILISFVRSNVEGKIGFLSISNRICVALSRAKIGLYCIGNFYLFAEKNELWKKIMTLLTDKGMEGVTLKLKCQLHQETNVAIATGRDFQLNAPEGGCSRLCEFRLPCGHACKLSCHPYDREHKNFKCNEPCPKRCVRGHKCHKKCLEDCGPCLQPIYKEIPSCKHEILIPCSQNPDNISCNKQCPLQLSCGHQCKGDCSKPCLSCSVTVKSKALCGHEVNVSCSKSDDEWEKLKQCNAVCKKELDCGHLCKGSCSLCTQFRFHIPCNEKCNRVLVCGHECKYPCAKNCPPCERKCENRCVHSLCPKVCGEECSKCNEMCKWRCKHLRCTRICGEKCNRPPCNEPCEKRLKCGHQCIGLCGEKCPRLCRICNQEEVTEIFFGTEDEPNARFIQLEDCIHTFEVTGLTQYMEMENDGKTEVQMRPCPKCKVAIRKSLRFGNVIKSCLQQIEMVKEKVLGLASDNKEKKQNLLDDTSVLEKDITSIKSTICELRKVSKFKIDHYVVDNIVTTILNTLDMKQRPHAQSLVCIENYLMFLRDLVTLCKEFLHWNKAIENYRHTVDIMIWDFFSATIQTIFQVMNKNKAPTEQILHDINQEIHRLTVFTTLFQLIGKTSRISVKSEGFLKFYNKAVCKLLTFGPLTNDDIEMVKADLVEASKHTDGVVLGISNEERESIVKAMGLTKGHWFCCPNGHVYCITECGGAMQEGKCNECQAIIGGRHHMLRDDNRLARAMDNAQHAAWSDAANMQNFDWNQFLRE